MNKEQNMELFNGRVEPPLLMNRNNRSYINLRITEDIILLQELLGYLKKQFGTNYVIASWISPPFWIIKGYGVYTREEAQHLAKRSKGERWGFPRFGSIYDKKRLEERIEQLNAQHQHRSFAYQL